MSSPALSYRRLMVGDPAPWFHAATPSSPRYAFDTVAGRPVVLCFFCSAHEAETRAVLEAWMQHRGVFDDHRACFFGVTVDPRDRVLQESIPGVRFFQDFSGEVSRLYGALPRETQRMQGAGYRLFSLVLDARLRVAGIDYFRGDARQHVASLMNILQGLEEADRGIGDDMPAPVLTVPRVFEPELCQQLIDYYRRHGGEESGFMREQNGRTVGVYDHSFKKRKDCTLEDEQLMAACRERMNRRLVPAIKQAFQFDASRIERWLVARYDGSERDFFRAHRDNMSGATAHRQFAVSIHLNAEGFSGGGVRFPEFGSRVYSPPTGGALVFSCSLLHEALPVTGGERFTFLPFLYGEQAARVREENQHLLAGNINTPEEAGLGGVR